TSRTFESGIGEMLLVRRYHSDEGCRAIQARVQAATGSRERSSAVKERCTAYQQLFPDQAGGATPVPIVASRPAALAMNEIGRPINYCYGIENRLCFFLLSGARVTAPRD